MEQVPAASPDLALTHPPGSSPTYQRDDGTYRIQIVKVPSVRRRWWRFWVFESAEILMDLPIPKTDVLPLIASSVELIQGSQDGHPSDDPVASNG